uniref:CSON001609 protein n=1 Tax=Culicoides sonorensis TaxID=179676 RepID=A0A336MH25_CULSO
MYPNVLSFQSSDGQKFQIIVTPVQPIQHIPAAIPSVPVLESMENQITHSKIYKRTTKIGSILIL